MASRPVIAKYLALFHELYPTRDVTDLTAEAWEYATADLGDVAFQWAADRVLCEPGRTFFPTPNELRAHLSHNRLEQPRRLTDPNDAVGNAVEAWYADPDKWAKLPAWIVTEREFLRRKHLREVGPLSSIDGPLPVVPDSGDAQAANPALFAKFWRNVEPMPESLPGVASVAPVSR